MISSNLTITFLCLSFNDEKIIQKTIDSIRSQSYNQKNVKILFLDGGSKDETLNIIKKNNCNLYFRPDLKDSPFLRIELGSKNIETDYTVFWSCDCNFTNPNTLEKSVMLLQKNDDAVAAWSSRYSFTKDNNYLTKYLAIIGAVDPVAHALKKSERIPYDEDKWHSYGKVIQDNNDYIKLKIKPHSSDFPAAGANFFIVKTKALKQAKTMLKGLHVEFCIRLSELNYNFLVIKGIDIIHNIDCSVMDYFKRKIKWAEIYSKNNNIIRSYYVFSKKDLFKIIKFILNNILIIPQLIIFLNNFIKTKNVIWFHGIYINNIAIIYYTIYYAKKIIKTRIHNNNS